MCAFFNSLLNKILLSVLLVGVAASAAAHTYFFGVTDLTINKTSKHIEVIHQFTAHDIENTIAEEEQVNFSPEHPQYDKLVQNYIEKHFSLQRDNKQIQMIWIGFEVRRGLLFAYQESMAENFLANLVVKNTILVDTYAKQVNTVNYQDFSSIDKVQGSLTFDLSSRVAVVMTNK
mgnify:CR=1 FL=1